MTDEDFLAAEIRGADIAARLPAKLHRFCTQSELDGWDAHMLGGNPGDSIAHWAGWLAREIWLHGIHEPHLDRAPVDGYPTLRAVFVRIA